MHEYLELLENYIIFPVSYLLELCEHKFLGNIKYMLTLAHNHL